MFNFRFSKKYYAPALGGIMLSIGVQLSVKDFAVVFKRWVTHLTPLGRPFATKLVL